MEYTAESFGATLIAIMAPVHAGKGRFATTQWSLVLAAAGSRSNDEEALTRLCSLYWYPVFAFVRRQVSTADEAQDLTQGFFTRLLEKRELAHADRERGRFRSFLLTACRHYISNERDRAHAIKRGGTAITVPIDAVEAERRYERVLSTTETPERIYERQWALTVMSLALETLRREYRAAGNELLFERLSEFLTETGDSQAEAASDLGMSLPAVKMAVHRMKKRYREALRECVAATLDSTAAVDDEIRHLIDAVGV